MVTFVGSMAPAEMKSTRLRRIEKTCREKDMQINGNKLNSLSGDDDAKMVKEMAMVARHVVLVVVEMGRYALAIQALEVDPWRDDPIRVRVYNEAMVSSEETPWLLVQPKVPCPSCFLLLLLLRRWCHHTFDVAGSNLPPQLLLPADVFGETYISACNKFHIPQKLNICQRKLIMISYNIIRYFKKLKAISYIQKF